LAFSEAPRAVFSITQCSTRTNFILTNQTVAERPKRSEVESSQMTVILSDCSAAKGVEGPAAAFAFVSSLTPKAAKLPDWRPHANNADRKSHSLPPHCHPEEPSDEGSVVAVERPKC
jgi:hypothetical protein